MKNIDYIITKEILAEFGNRKTEGRIDFVFNLRTSQMYPVPKNLEHSKFIPTLQGYYPRTNIFVSSQLRLDKDGKVKEIITGASSYEANENVLHPMKDLHEAHRLMWNVVINSSLQLDLERDEVLKNYATA